MFLLYVCVCVCVCTGVSIVMFQEFGNEWTLGEMRYVYDMSYTTCGMCVGG